MSIPTKQKVLFLESKQGRLIVDTADILAPGAGEVLVRVEAAALNPLDWKIQTLGFYVGKYPAVLGFDAAGTVVQLGAGVTSLALAFPRGTTLCSYLHSRLSVVQDWYESATQLTHGTFHEYFVLPAEFAAKVGHDLR